MRPDRQQLIRALFDEYITMYATRDEHLIGRFSDNFTGYTGGSGFLVKDRDEWMALTRQDFAEVPGVVSIEMLDLAIQELCDEVVIVTACFHIHLPKQDGILSNRTARLVLAFRLEDEEWKISHSGLSIPYSLARSVVAHPLHELDERNQALQALVDRRTHELAEANNKLEALGHVDGLTGISNRHNFERLFQQEWKRCQRMAKPLSLIMLDADHFKIFNDHYGHQAGDACLRMLAGALTQSGRRAGELTARYGGEEFVMLLPETDGASALEIAHNLQRDVWSLALPNAGSKLGIVTVSLGVACLVPSVRHRPEDLLQQAELAVFRAKQAGRNCVHLDAS